MTYFIAFFAYIIYNNCEILGTLYKKIVSLNLIFKERKKMLLTRDIIDKNLYLFFLCIFCCCCLFDFYLIGKIFR